MSNDMSSDTPDATNATDADFQQIVLEASKEVPVLVDFWAPWCGPCKVIGPVLEKLAQEANGRFKLVKVNMDESPMLAQALQIQSIPAVKLFVNGAIKDEFAGAYPEPEIRKFLDQNLPTETDQEAASGLDVYVQGDKEQALGMFQEALKEDSDNPIALIGMGNHQFDEGNTEEARDIVTQISGIDLDHLPDKANAEKALAGLRAKLFLFDTRQAVSEAENSAAEAEGIGPRLHKGCELALGGAHQEALEEFLAIVQKDRSFMGDAGRKAMVAVFDLLPNDSEITYSYRNMLSSLLFN